MGRAQASLASPVLRERHKLRALLQGRRSFDLSDREIDTGYRCVTAYIKIVSISLGDFSGAGCSKHRGNDLARVTGSR
jgi:hypothetical protein